MIDGMVKVEGVDFVSEVQASLLRFHLQSPSEEDQLNHFRAMFLGFAYISEFQVPGAVEHLKRVSAYTAYMAEHVLDWSELEAKRLGVASILHDIGKIAIPISLLQKNGPLTKDERIKTQAHSTIGHDIITHMEKHALASLVSFDKKLFTFSKQIALHHHENFNGTGYPYGLAGDSIPIAARVVKITDVMDALLSRRAYKEPWSWFRTRKEMEALQNEEFDSYLLRRLLEHEEALVKMAF